MASRKPRIGPFRGSLLWSAHKIPAPEQWLSLGSGALVSPTETDPRSELGDVAHRWPFRGFSRFFADLLCAGFSRTLLSAKDRWPIGMPILKPHSGGSPRR